VFTPNFIGRFRLDSTWRAWPRDPQPPRAAPDQGRPGPTWRPAQRRHDERHGVERRHAEQQPLHQAREGDRAEHAERDARADHEQAFAQHEAHEIAPLGTEGRADAELAIPLGDAVGQRTVEADPGEEHSDTGERSHHAGSEARRVERCGDARRERFDPVDDHVAVDLADERTDVLHQRRRLARRPDDQVHAPGGSLVQAPVSWPTAGFNRMEWRQCTSSTPVVYQSVLNSGHAWPGGEPGREGALPPSRDFDASTAMWEFFKTQARAR
jgi:hypothetical protein